MSTNTNVAVTLLHPVSGLSSTTVYVPRLALFPPGASFRLRLGALAVTPASAVTVATFEVRSPLPVSLAAGTRTASVGRPRKSPAKASVRQTSMSKWALKAPSAISLTCWSFMSNLSSVERSSAPKEPMTTA